MAITNLSFSSQIDDWCRESEARVLAVRNQSADDVIDKMREYTPIQYGFLAGTIQGSLNAPTPIDPSKTNAANAQIARNASAGEVSMVIAGATLNDTIFGCFTMSYAGYVEYGTSRMEPRAMVRRAAQEWQQIVSKNVAKAKAAVAKGR